MDGNGEADSWAKHGAKQFSPPEQQIRFASGCRRFHRLLLEYLARFEVWFYSQEEQFLDYCFPVADEDEEKIEQALRVEEGSTEP
eukprot:325442-Pyramimonas_sp.AAC.1